MSAAIGETRARRLTTALIFIAGIIEGETIDSSCSLLLKQMLLTGLVVLAYFAAVEAYNNGVGGTPPMGWSTWCTNDLCGLRDKCSEFEVIKFI